MQYTELHLHGHNSLLDGLNTSAEYMKRANEIGMTHLALTDHGTNAGHREHQRAAKEAGIVPILGQEMYISETDRFDRRSKAKREDGTNVYNHLIVLAQNAEGLKNLNALSAIGWTEGYYFKPRIDMEVLEEHSDGLIVLSGCLSGLLSKAIDRGDFDAAVNHAKQFKRIFGDRFFIEVQDHNPLNINAGLMEISRQGKIKPVVTSDCHYAREEDLWLEEAMLILATNPKQNRNFDYEKSKAMDFIERFNYAYPDRTMSFQDYEIFLKNAEQHLAGLEKHGIGQEAIDNTMIVAEMIEDDYPYFEGESLLPKIEVKGETAAQTLERMSWQGLKERGLDTKQEYRDRLQEELDIIMPRFPEYFIIEADFVQWALGQGILVGPGRGSGAGSLVNYALRITNVDPIKFKLLFFRFINPERNDEPDIDTDFEKRRRGEVKDYVKRKYTHVASIANFNTFQGKSAVRDAARVFLVPLGDVNYALKGADWPSGMDFFDQWDPTDRAKDFSKKYPEVIKLAKFMYGRLKTQGMHAGGVVLSNSPISDYAPMQSAKDTNDESGDRIPLVALDMNEAAAVGFIKYDMLGVKVLSTIGDTLALVEERHNKVIDLDNLPLDDKNVYAELSEGFTKGVFQCEAVPYTNLIIKMGGVKNFDELVASNALVRPGAMKSSAGEAFIKRKFGQEMVTYPHKDMQWFTDDTYGVVIYQEQVMLAMTELAGMSMGTADKVRKIIGKKKDVSEFEQYKSEFIEGASQKVSSKVAEGLWHDFEAHAGYSFNKSHAVAYSMLSYWTAWLKYHYPLEFMVSLLKNEEDNDSLLDYLIETKRMGIRVMLPHVNASNLDFEIQTNNNGDDIIRFGLSDIKFISDKISGRILDQRPFRDYAHLLEVSQTKGSGISSRVLDSLNRVGGAAFPDNPRTGTERENFYEYLNIPAFETKGIHPRIQAQLRTLDEFSDTESFVSLGMVRGIKTGPGWKRIEIVDETGSVGIFAEPDLEIETGNMYVFLIANNRVAKFISIDALAMDVPLDEDKDFREFLEATGFPDLDEDQVRVVSFNGRRTKAGKDMADVTFSDENKELRTAVVWPTQFIPAFVKLKEGASVKVTIGELEDGGYALDKIL
jgi:DNA polymerase-3 subunit alpha